MNKKLEQINKRSEAILKAYLPKKTECAAALKAAGDAVVKARAAVEAAEDPESYERATADLNHAELVERFAEKELNRLDAAPRMDEDEYTKAVNTCTSLINEAVANYREKAAALMDQLKSITDEYKQTVEETNRILETLDSAANVLQVKYPYKTISRQGWADEQKRDSRAWLEHAVRYDAPKACYLATRPDAESGAEPGHNYHNYDSVLFNAWRAVDKGYPRMTY